MTRDIVTRLSKLSERRTGLDRLNRISRADSLSVLAKSLATDEYVRRAEKRQYTQYALGAMQAVDAEYTRISIEEAQRVGKQLSVGLNAVGISVQFRLQGSVPSDLHIRGVSDVDLLVLDDRYLTYDPKGARALTSAYFPTHYVPVTELQVLRARAEAILRDKYPAADVDASGAKAIKLSGGSLRRPVDVVPAHWEDTFDYQSSNNETFRGVRILDKAVPTSVINLPFKHISKIDESNSLSFGGLKKAIRLCKNIKADAIDEGIRMTLSSFDIASLMWHAHPPSLTTNSSEELKILGETARHLDYLVRNPETASELLVPDGSRKVLDRPEKVESLVQLSLEIDDLALQVAREQQPARVHFDQSIQVLVEALAASVVPA
jgi:hypothetical protein